MINSIHPKMLQIYVIYRIYNLPKHVDDIERKVFTEKTTLLMEVETNLLSVRKTLKSYKSVVFPKFYTATAALTKLEPVSRGTYSLLDQRLN